MQGAATVSESPVVRVGEATTRDYAVTASTGVFRVMREELCVGLPRVESGAGLRRTVPCARPDAVALDAGLDAAARIAAGKCVPIADIVRIGSAGVRVLANPDGSSTMHIVSWAIARPLASQSGIGKSVEAEEHFVPLSALPTLDASARSILSCISSNSAKKSSSKSSSKSWKK